MSTSYETRELIASHHLELDRLCQEVLDLGSRVSADEPEADVLRWRARALGWRLRAHRAEEAAALIAEGGDAREVIAERLRKNPAKQVEEVERVLATADDKQPLELALEVCAAARACRATLDRIAHS